MPLGGRQREDWSATNSARECTSEPSLSGVVLTRTDASFIGMSPASNWSASDSATDCASERSRSGEALTQNDTSNMGTSSTRVTPVSIWRRLCCSSVSLGQWAASSSALAKAQLLSRALGHAGFVSSLSMLTTAVSFAASIGSPISIVRTFAASCGILAPRTTIRVVV